jgi:Tfp pilus assembly protein PilO
MTTKPGGHGGRGSIKRVQIDKSQSTMLIVAGVAAFVLAFTLVGGKALIGQITYQNKVISAKKATVQQLRSNVQAVSSLETSYKAFTSTSQNIIGGNPQGNDQRDGDNAKIVLDALPSKYDFPALVSSVEKLANDQKLGIESISGSDDEVTQTENASSPDPKPVDMPFQVTVNGSYPATKSLLDAFNRSIRPFQLTKLQLSGGQASMTAKIEAKTFYQPAKNFNITKKVVK